jgi:hypothetical protein
MATSACGWKCFSARTGCRRRRGWSGSRSRRSTARSCVEWTLSTSETNKCELPLRLQLNKPNNFLSAAFAACHHSKCADSESHVAQNGATRSSSVLGWSHSLQASSRNHIDGRPQSARRPQQHLLRNIIYRARVPPSPAPSSCALRFHLQALHHGRYRHGAAGSTFQMRDPFKRVRGSVLTASVQSSSSDHAAARHKQCAAAATWRRAAHRRRPLNKMMHASAYIDPCRATTSAICNSVGA